MNIFLLFLKYTFESENIILIFNYCNNMKINIFCNICKCNIHNVITIIKNYIFTFNHIFIYNNVKNRFNTFAFFFQNQSIPISQHLMKLYQIL